MELDPWLITTKAEMAAVLRDGTSSGFYRVTADLYLEDSAVITLLFWNTNAGRGPKVIDLNGFEIRVGMDFAFTGAVAIFSTTHFKNGVINASVTTSSASATIYAFHRCFATDCAIRIISYGPAITYLFLSGATNEALIEREIKRVVITRPGPANTAMTAFTQTSIESGVAVSDVYIFTSGTTDARFTKRVSMISLASLPAVFGGNGWWESASLLYPHQIETVTLSLVTLAGGSATRRLLWLENDRKISALGESDSAGVVEAIARVRKNTGFTIYASEDLVAASIRAGAAIVAADWYAPPIQNNYIYQASASGVLGILDGVVFDSSPVVISGITFTPLLRRLAAVSDRLTVTAFGTAISRTLDNAAGGGGGPVVDGDPAYLDGVVEDIHPMLGTVRALVNAEVLVFEKRATGYVAMGSAYSNALGEFRVETDVYGGGDIFAFAADFPGVIWHPGVVLNLGDRVRPTVNNGYVYEVITAGNSGATEPAWWADAGDGTEGAIGSATAQARPYYQPVGHGPLKMTLVE